MNTLKNLTKKAIAIGTGAVMTAATIAGAAADLSAYPAPFVQNGQFNGLIVVGEKAATADVLGSIEIASSLQAASTTVVAGSGASTVTLEGDNSKIGDGSDMLEIGEQIGLVTESLTASDLELLRGGVVTTDKGTTEYTQTLTLNTGAPGTSNRVVLDENDDDETGMYLVFENGADIFEYELEFTSGLESDVDADDNAEDLEDESLFMLGQFYTIVDTSATNPGAAPDVTLELIAGDVTDTLSEGDTKTYTIDGKEYEVTILFVSDTNAGTAKFLVNGETTDSLGEGDTDKVAGIDIGVREVLSQSRGTTGGTLVEFYVGANKMEITDANIAVDDGAATLEINGENIDDVDADISGTFTGTSLRINSLSMTLAADAAEGSTIYIPKGAGLREFLDEPEGMLAGLDFRFEGVTAPETTNIEFDAQGDDEYQFTFTNRRDQEFTVPYAVISAGGVESYGDDNDQLVFWETYADDAADEFDDDVVFAIDDDDYFVLTSDMDDNGADSYVLQFDDVDTDDQIVTFRVVGGEDIEASYTPANLVDDAADSAVAATAMAAPTGNIKIGGQDYPFWLRQVGGAGAFTLAVDLNNDGELAGVAAADAQTSDTSANSVEQIVTITVKGGGLVRLANDVADVPAPAGDAWAAEIRTLDEDLDQDETQTSTIDFTGGGAAAELDLSIGVATSGTLFEQSVNDEDRDLAVNEYGTMFEATTETNEADSVTIMYPAQQVEALVYVIGGEVQTAEVAGGSGVRVNPIKVGSAVLDSDVTLGQANMIVIGGPCANTAAAALLGNPAVCGEGFVPGKAVIKYIDGAAAGGKVAVLVAGYEAQETQGASRVLAQYDLYDLEGREVEVSVTSLTQSGIRVN